MSAPNAYAQGIAVHVPPQQHPKAKEKHLIAKVETFYVRPRLLFVRVETTTGVVGWGEATLEGNTEAVEGGLKEIARRYAVLASMDETRSERQDSRLGCHEYRGGMLEGVTHTDPEDLAESVQASLLSRWTGKLFFRVGGYPAHLQVLMSAISG